MISTKNKLFLFALVHLFFSTHHSFCSIELEQPENPDWITIFIHGTVSPDLCLQNIIKIIKDNVDKSAYALSTELVRNDPFFHKTQAIQQLGLQKIDQPRTASYVFAKIYDELGSINAPTKQKTVYYTFGWSGLISYKQRKKEAFILFDQLQQELAQYKKRNCTPKIRIIGYSHGGNIALNLVHALQERKMPLMINELILIGMPVQSATDLFVDHPLFERIYHFYSLNDHVQRLDFATRRFLDRKTFEVPHTKLTQLKIKMHGALSNKQGKYRTRNMDPGHIELWFFGWTPRMYRKKFPCQPLPIAVLIQWFIHEIEKFTALRDSLEIDIDFKTAQAILRCYRSLADPGSQGTNKKSRIKQVSPFPFTKFEEMKQYAQTIKPERGTETRELHKKRRYWARTQANYFKRLYLINSAQKTRKKHKKQPGVELWKKKRPTRLYHGNTVSRRRFCLNRQNLWF